MKINLSEIEAMAKDVRTTQEIIPSRAYKQESSVRLYPETVLALVAAVRALQRIAKPTYGTELCNSDRENWRIVESSMASMRAVAREALEPFEL